MASGFDCWRENISSGAVPKFVVLTTHCRKQWLESVLKKPLRTGPDSLSPPRLNDLLRGKIDKDGLDALFDFTGRVGLKVSIALRKAA